ncbi:putative neurobeachin/beige protein, partial [Trypanosoma cruzi]
NVAVAAVKRVAAHETPEVVIGLCHIVDVSSRSIVPSPKDEKKPSISTQIAMYENVLMALEALFQLLQVKDDEPWSQELVLRQEIVLQQILNHDLARAVERLLRHCPTILDADSTLFQSIGTLCTPPFTSSRRRRRQSTVSRVENSTQCVPGNGDSLSGSMCSRNASMVSLTSSIHVSRPALPEGSVARASNLARSLWMSVWPGASRGSGVAGLTHAHAASRPAPSDDEPIGSFFQRGTSDMI